MSAKIHLFVVAQTILFRAVNLGDLSCGHFPGKIRPGWGQVAAVSAPRREELDESHARGDRRFEVVLSEQDGDCV